MNSSLERAERSPWTAPAADHTRYTEALGYRMSDQIGEVLLRDLNNAEMIFEFQHTVYLPD